MLRRHALASGRSYRPVKVMLTWIGLDRAGLPALPDSTLLNSEKESGSRITSGTPFRAGVRAGHDANASIPTADNTAAISGTYQISRILSAKASHPPGSWIRPAMS